MKQAAPAEPAHAPRPCPGVTLRCTWCRESLGRDAAVFCAACLAGHHLECLVEHGECAAPGCGETRCVRPMRLRSPRLSTRERALALVLACVTVGALEHARRRIDRIEREPPPWRAPMTLGK